MMRGAVLVFVLAVGLMAEAQRIVIRNSNDPDNPTPAGGVPGTLIIQTTFASSKCAAETQAGPGGTPGNEWGGNLDICESNDGWSSYGSGPNGTPFPQCTNGDEITASANYSSGGGGYGMRHCRADGFDHNGGGIQFIPTQISASWTNINMRWYMRYASGFAWQSSGNCPGFTKDIYVLGFGLGDYALGFESCSNYRITPLHEPDLDSGGYGWTSIMGGFVGDGAWHCFEYQMYPGSGGASNTKLRLWIDGTLRSTTDTFADWDNGEVWSNGNFVFGHNGNDPLVDGTGNWYTDYDDIIIAKDVGLGNTIGCSLAAS